MGYLSIAAIGPIFEIASRLIGIKERFVEDDFAELRLEGLAEIIANKGYVREAIRLYKRAAQLGDENGRAIRFLGIAFLAEKKGDLRAARRHAMKSCKHLVSASDWSHLITALQLLSTYDTRGGSKYIAQAVWLALRTGTPPERIVPNISLLMVKLGLETKEALSIGMMGIGLAKRAGEAFLESEEWRFSRL